jgi:hypothetical protein
VADRSGVVGEEISEWFRVVAGGREVIGLVAAVAAVPRDGRSVADNFVVHSIITINKKKNHSWLEPYISGFVFRAFVPLK